MTQDRLRELLRERVADETGPDLSARAWQRARVVRRRRRLTVVAGVVAATVAVSGGIAALGGNPPEPAPAPPAPTAAEPDTTLRGVPVWFSPDPAEERALPQADTGVLPPELDASPGAPALADEPVERAAVALAVLGEVRLDRLVVVTAAGERRSVDVSGIGEVTKANGYRLWPTGDLSPDGRHLLFPQPGSVRVLRLADATWSDVPAGSTEPGTTYGARWVGDDVFALPSGESYDVTGAARGDVVLPSPPVFPLADRAAPYGRAATSPRSTRVAQAWGMGTDLPARDPGADLSDPDGIWVDPGRAPGAALSITWPVAGEGRWKDCCPVAGWLSDDVLVYESHTAEPVLVGWTVATSTFAVVSRIVGVDEGQESYVASWSDLG